MSRYSRSTSISFGYPRWTPAVRALIIACAIVWILQIMEHFWWSRTFSPLFELTPSKVLSGYIWQPASYIFLHDPLGPLHLLFNMLALWMFGSELERTWGSRRFLKYFFLCGIGAGLLMVLIAMLARSPQAMNIHTIGASGAVYGVLLAFGVLWPDAIIYWIIFPIKAKWFVMIMGGLAFYFSLTAVGGGVAHVAHLGGMLVGLVYLKSWRWTGGIQDQYNQWRRARLRRKFEVYYNERHKDEERWRRWKN